jgi:undecaprenyl-diphosphatase
MIALLLDIMQEVKSADTSAFLTVNGCHNSYWDTFMWLVSDRFIWVPMYLSLLYVLLRNYSPKVVLGILVSVGVIVLFTDSFSSQVIRPWIARLRPSNLQNPISGMVHIVDGHRGGSYGFPSSHASNTWGLVFFMAYLLRRHWLTGFLFVWAAIVCYSRMYLGVHYFGDIIVGALFGLLGSSVVYYVFQRLSGKKYKQNLKYTYVPVWVGLSIFAIIFITAIFYRV